MPFSGFLSTYYGIQVEEKIWLDGKEGYRNGNNYYFTTSIDNKEMVYLEQASLAYYLIDNHLEHTSVPIPNLQGEWFTPYHDHNYMVIKVQEMKHDDRNPDGIVLANFHQIGARYQYQPREISSYGAWKSLWIDKLTVFEAKMEEEANQNPCAYYRLLMDVFPYVIGISENAIQYMNESEAETRFHESDQGTITFNRYKNQLRNPILWTDNLMYDHPARDIAEYIRYSLVRRDNQNNIITFLNDYQSVRPLSIFSLRLIYGRLLYPVHFYDLINRGFLGENVDSLYVELKELLGKQNQYEEAVRQFFERLGIDPEASNIPVLHWL
ncbi:hypothetical protein [Oceanobacillus halophilus]|uniref:Spore coat protein YutH n=1 Tax=Oceanobacillus halophilus TaxID=930130 RepID=A0A494ZTS2_9BACI|nr:hypothetical protein [Oceanobacillus halophilus]RKQ29597.1 hypothetical protein D8M06_17550 [Oceanobacillus halophilus]